MGRLVALFALCCSLAWGAECTTVTTSNKSLVQRGRQVVTTLNISFAGDTITAAWDFVFSGSVTQAMVEDMAFDICEHLTGHAGLTIGVITPTESVPTPKEQAVLDIQEAAQRRCALENYASLFGKLGTDLTGGAGSPTFDARRGTLQAVIDNNVSSGANLNNRVLDEWQFCAVDSPGNGRTPTWHATNAVVDAPAP